MGHVVHHVQTGDGLFLQAADGVALLLGEERDQNVRASGGLAAFGLHVEHGATHHALEAQRWLRLAALVAGRNQRRMFVDEGGEFGAQGVDVGADVVQHLHGFLFVQESQQHVLRRHELVALHARPLERFVEGGLQFFAKH